MYGVSYSTFMGALKVANIELDRKVLSDMAIRDAQGFANLVKLVVKDSTGLAKQA